MADYISLCRSNYVRPKNRDAFVAFLKTFDGIRVVEKDDRIGFCNEDGGMPSREIDDDDENLVHCNEEIGALLADREVMIVMEIGYEKIRFLNGYAWAIHSSGLMTQVSLNDIYVHAAAEFKVDPASINECSY